MDQMLAKHQETALSLFRFVTGLLLFQYGVAKIFNSRCCRICDVPPLIYTAGAIELVGGAVAAARLFTRPVAFILAGEMAFAYFLGHMFKGGVEALYSFRSSMWNRRDPVLLRLSLPPTAGGGPYSLDAMMRKKA